MSQKYCGSYTCFLSIFITFILCFGHTDAVYYHSDNKVIVVKTNENITEISGFGYSITQCTLKCQRKKLFEVLRTDEGRCYCFVKYIKSQEDDSDEKPTIEGKIYRETYQNLGASPTTAGNSCKDILERYENALSGYYWVQFNTPVLVYCDQETDGGGWMAIANITVGDTPGFTFSDSTLEQDIHKLNTIITGQFRLSSDKVANIEPFIGKITQYRFYCHKEWHGRTMHFSNKINAAGLLFRDAMQNPDVNWLQNGHCPDAFNFYDDSTMQLKCPYVTITGNKWKLNPYNRLYNHPIYNDGDWTLLLLHNNRFECDDTFTNSGFKTAGQWLYYVR